MRSFRFGTLLVTLVAAVTPAFAAAPVATKPGVHWLDYTILVAYLACIVLIGLFFRSGNASLKQYYRGENNIPSWAAGVSLMATRLTAVTFISIPAKAYATNWTYFLLPFSNLAVAYVVARWVVPFYCRLDLTSIYEYLEARFNSRVRLLGCLAFLSLETARLGVLILVPALVVTVISDLNIYLCILLIGAVTTVSTAIGGIKAVVWVDVLQAFLKISGALLCIGIVWWRVEQPLEGLAAAFHAGKLKLIEPSFDLSKASFVIIVLYWIGELKNYMANQTNAQRFMVTKDERAAKSSVWVGATSMVGMILLCLIMGTALYVFYQAHPERMAAPLAKPDELVPFFIIHEMPPGLGGLMLAAVFSASMASLNSALNSISAVVVTDLYRRYGRPREDRASVRFGKGVIWVAGALATGVGLMLAQYRIDSLFDKLTEVLGLFGGSLGGIFLLGIFTRRGDSRGALIGFVGSCAMLFYVKTYTTINLLAYLAIGMLSCFAIGYLVSRLWPKENKDLSGLTVHTAKM